MFTGQIRYNAKFRDRAYVTIEGIACDCLIEGNRNMNRSMDGDTVAVKLDNPDKWRLLPKEETSKYTNKAVIEQRVVDGPSVPKDQDAKVPEEMEGSESDWEDADSVENDKKARVYTLAEEKPAKKLIFELPGSAKKEEKPKVPHRFKGNRDQVLA